MTRREKAQLIMKAGQNGDKTLYPRFIAALAQRTGLAPARVKHNIACIANGIR